jgi:NET1-associated nuclear protein 1 (U3 small nucleolar RNA-associated protein 17)
VLVPPATAKGAPPAAAPRQLLFLADAPLLVAVGAGWVAVHDLLTLRCAWAAAAPAGHAAADPASPHWALVLEEAEDGAAARAAAARAAKAAGGKAGGAGAGGKPGGKDGEQAAGAGAPLAEQGVLAFRGAVPAPGAAWRRRRARPGPALLFAPPGAPLAAAAAAAALPGASPLLVLTADREYAVAAAPGAPAAALAAPAAATRGRRDTFAPAAFEALCVGAAADAGAAKRGGAAAAVAEAGARPRWAALFDAPSHALPPLSELCPAFLEVVLVGGGAPGDE